MLKGHLGQKSSPLAPTSCKLSKQMLVLQHMNAHYKKLANVKSSIDMSCPKTLSTSVRSRDTQSRRGGTSGRRPNSRPSSRPSSRISTDDNHFSSNQAFADDPVVDQIVREALGETQSAPMSPSAPYSGRSKPPLSPYAASSRPGSGRRALYEGSSSSRRPPSAGNSSVRAWLARPEDAGSERSQGAGAQSGDIIDCHAQRFTESRPFTPRTLRKNVPSKLSQFRYYNKPKTSMRRSQSASKMDETQDEKMVEERPVPARRRTSADVPALHIDADPDKVRWLEQQAEKAKLRQDVSSRSYGSPDLETQTRTMHDVQLKDMSAPFTATQKREEEELKYLEFYSDVTNDVLNRGIFTNKVLNQVFQYHLEKNKNHLRLSKMQEILGNIRRELGIPDNEDLDDSYGYGVVRPVLHPSRPRGRGEEEDEGAEATRVADLPPHRPLTDNDIMRYKLQARETERQLSGGSGGGNFHAGSPVASAEESHLKVCLTQEEFGSGAAHLDSARDIAPHVGVEQAASGSPREHTDGRRGSPDSEAVRTEADLMSTQDEVEMTQLHETMRRTYEQQRKDSVGSQGGPERDEPDAGADSEEFRDHHWSKKTALNESYNEADSSAIGEFSEAGATPLHDDLDRTDSVSEPPTPTTRNLMTMTLRPGMFNTLMGRASEDEEGAGAAAPAARARLGKSVTFANEDELLETRESEDNNATLTDVSAPALEMSSLRQNLPSASSEYDDDFEDDDGF